MSELGKGEIITGFNPETGEPRTGKIGEGIGVDAVSLTIKVGDIVSHQGGENIVIPNPTDLQKAKALGGGWEQVAPGRYVEKLPKAE